MTNKIIDEFRDLELRIKTRNNEEYKETIEYAINEFEKAVIEATHKNANEANKHYVNRLKQELVELFLDILK